MSRIRALIALGALTALLGGLPWALATFGRWPITGIPSNEQIRNVGDAVVSDTAVFGVLTLAAWLVWALFTISFLVESRAAMRGLQAPQIALAGPLQRAARLLVATIILGVTVQHTAPPASALPTAPPSQSPTAVAAHLSDHRVDIPSPPESVPLASSPSEATHRVTITVANGDSAWSLAEIHLGDGMRWRELWEANRSVVQPDGRRWSDPQIIRPGWRLELPAGDDHVAARNGAVHVVERGDTLSEIAAEELGDLLRYKEIFHLNVGDLQPDGRRLEEPNLILPGWELKLPADSPAAPTAPTEPEDAEPSVEPQKPVVLPPPPPADAPAVPTTTTPAPTASARPTTAVESSEDPLVADAGGWTIAAATLAGVSGALAAGLAVRLRRLRHRRSVRGAHGHAPLSDALATTETAILAAADVPLVRWASQNLAQLVSKLDHRKISAGPVAVEISEHAGIEILWEQPQPTAPDPWRPADGGWAWRLAYDPEAIVPSAELPSAIPALVTVGRRDGRQLFVDLEAYGAISVDGPTEQVEAFLRSIAIELAASEDVTDADVLVVGIDTGMEVLDRLKVVSPEAAETALTRTAEQVSESLTTSKRSDTFHARAGGSVPIEATVTVATGLADADVEQLIGRCGSRRGVALVIEAPEGAAPAHIHIDGEGGARLRPLGVEFEPVGLAESTASQVGDLLEVLEAEPETRTDVVVDIREILASDADGHEARDEPRATNGHVVKTQTFPEFFPEPTVDRSEPTLVVHVLGTPSVPDRPDIGRRELILTTYLACRQGPVAASAVQDALWGGKPVETKTVWNVIGATRRALGDMDDGCPVLPAADRTRGGSLQLAEGVATDLALLRQLVNQADGSSSSEAIVLLREGLTFVTGPPFDAVGYDWAYRDQDVAEASTLIEQTAERLVELALEAGQLDIAREAVVRGLRGLPGNEELYRCRMRVEHHAGNLAGVTAAYEELVTYLDDLETEPSPATSALFHELARPAGRR